MSRAIWLVLDSLGVGAAPDAADYGDAGADTFGHVAAACAAAARGPLRLPNFTTLGLPQAHAAAHGQPAPGFGKLPAAAGLWGYAVERARGKDTPSGHWETTGVVLREPFGVFAPAPLDGNVAESSAGTEHFLTISAIRAHLSRG